jgi:hypothetical protein
MQAGEQNVADEHMMAPESVLLASPANQKGLCDDLVGYRYP